MPPPRRRGLVTASSAALAPKAKPKSGVSSDRTPNALGARHPKPTQKLPSATASHAMPSHSVPSASPSIARNTATKQSAPGSSGIYDEASTAAMAKKARAMKEQLRKGGGSSGTSLHHAVAAATSSGPARPAGDKKGRMAAFGVVEEEKQKFSRTVIDPLDEDDHIDMKNLRKFSKGFMAREASDDDDNSVITGPALARGGVAFRSRAQRAEAPDLQPPPSSYPTGPSSTFVSTSRTTKPATNDDDEFNRPASRISGMTKQVIKTTADSYGQFEQTQKGIEGIRRWLQDLNSDLEGKNLHLRHVGLEIDRLKTHLSSDGDGRSASTTDTTASGSAELEACLDAFQELQTFHRLISTLSAPDSVARGTNEDVTLLLETKLAALETDHVSVQNGQLSPFSPPEEVGAVRARVGDIFAGRGDWQDLMTLANNSKDIEIKIEDDFGRMNIMVGGEIKRRAKSVDQDDSRSDFESSASDVST